VRKQKEQGRTITNTTGSFKNATLPKLHGALATTLPRLGGFTLGLIAHTLPLYTTNVKAAQTRVISPHPPR
jgi:hypothetical protein